MFRTTYNGVRVEVDSISELNDLIKPKKELGTMKQSSVNNKVIKKKRGGYRRANHQSKWTDLEDNKLWSMRAQRKKVLAKQFKRTVAAVQWRLYYLKQKFKGVNDG